MREHRWLGDHCTSCAMARDWPGARHDCPVQMDRKDHEARARRRAGLPRRSRAQIARLVREVAR